MLYVLAPAWSLLICQASACLLSILMGCCWGGSGVLRGTVNQAHLGRCCHSCSHTNAVSPTTWCQGQGSSRKRQPRSCRVPHTAAAALGEPEDEEVLRREVSGMRIMRCGGGRWGQFGHTASLARALGTTCFSAYSFSIAALSICAVEGKSSWGHCPPDSKVPVILHMQLSGVSLVGQPGGSQWDLMAEVVVRAGTARRPGHSTAGPAVQHPGMRGMVCFQSHCTRGYRMCMS